VLPWVANKDFHSYVACGVDQATSASQCLSGTNLVQVRLLFCGSSITVGWWCVTRAPVRLPKQKRNEALDPERFTTQCDSWRSTVAIRMPLQSTCSAQSGRHIKQLVTSGFDICLWEILFPGHMSRDEVIEDVSQDHEARQWCSWSLAKKLQSLFSGIVCEPV